MSNVQKRVSVCMFLHSIRKRLKSYTQILDIITQQHKTFLQHLYNVGPTSSTLVQHCTNAIKMFCVYWIAFFVFVILFFRSLAPVVKRYHLCYQNGNAASKVSEWELSVRDLTWPWRVHNETGEGHDEVGKRWWGAPSVTPCHRLCGDR